MFLVPNRSASSFGAMFLIYSTMVQGVSVGAFCHLDVLVVSAVPEPIFRPVFHTEPGGWPIVFPRFSPDEESPSNTPSLG